MDKDRVIGAAKQVAGRVKQFVGRTFGDTKLQVEGRAEKLDGKLQNAAGSVKDTLKR